MQSLYTFQNSDIVLYEGTKPYVLKVRDMPSHEKPREKLLAKGVEVLTVAELLAVVLGVGTRKEEVMAMSSRILKEYGQRTLASEKKPEHLARELDIPISKAAQVVACAELGRRFFHRNDVGVATLRTAEEVFHYVAGMRTLSKEHLRGLYLNAHYKVIHDEVISIGTVNTNIIHPREVFKPALEYCAAAVIIVHNHPSGDIHPSDADIEVTERLKKAANILNIDFLDHVIVAKKGFKSILHDQS